MPWGCLRIMNVDATQEQIDKLGVGHLHPALCQLALSLARMADEATAPTALAAVAAQLRAVLLDLCKLAPAANEGDALDDLTAKREARRSRTG